MDHINVAGLKVAIVPDLEAPIWYLEQAVGSGKTEVVVKTIKSNDRQSYIFVAPTLNLLAEIETRLRAANVANVYALHSGTIRNPPSWVKGILLSFLNCDPTDEMEADRIYSQFRLSQTYQTVGRCSLRDRSRRDGNIVVVLSRQCAVELANLFEGAQICGCITSLQSFSKLDRERKNAGKAVLYEPRDNKAWCVWKKRHPEFHLTKEEWYRRCRIPLRA